MHIVQRAAQNKRDKKLKNSKEFQSDATGVSGSLSTQKLDESEVRNRGFKEEAS